MSNDLILGTAGHIDHGKTALVKALTGVDTDRLPEEKRRGITIDLGFAELVLGPYRLGIVDVPGHERFVRNMLAGATGIDLALLVIAADESVKPQTREHLHILRLLGLDSGVIALTKYDLPQPEWIELVEEEVGELVAGTFLADAPVVRTSAVTGMGLEELRAALRDAAEKAVRSARRARRQAPFQMAIDRAFTIAGHGTVVTGSVAGGQARLGDELVIEPGGMPVRVRGLENHGRHVEEVHRGQRAAVNLAGVHHHQLERGQELASPGHLVPSRLLSVRLSLLPSAPRPLKHRARARVHLGTAELIVSAALLDRDQLRPGEGALAQLLLSRPAVSTWGQPLVIRSESPVMTIGGGQVLDPDALRLGRGDGRALAWLADLSSSDPVVRAAAAAALTGPRPWGPRDLARTAGIDDVPQVYQDLIRQGLVVEIAVSPTRTVRLHRAVLEDLAGRTESVLRRLHQQSPLQPAMERSRVVGLLPRLADEGVIEAVLSWMTAAGRIASSPQGLALAGFGPRLSDKERELVDRIVAIYRQAAFQPPSVQQLKDQIGRSQAALPELIALATAEHRLVKVSAEYYLAADVELQLRETLAAHLAEGPGLSVSRIREILATSRKYAVPLCEYLDRIGFTRRQGDLRVLDDRYAGQAREGA